MAYAIGKYGVSTLTSLGSLIALFYVTSALFVFVVLAHAALEVADDRHVGVGGVGRVGHSAHDVEQELLALAIEISELRHLSPPLPSLAARPTGGQAWRTL